MQEGYKVFGFNQKTKIKNAILKFKYKIFNQTLFQIIKKLIDIGN